VGEQIERILWDEKDHFIEVAYREREPDRIVANRQIATMLTEDVGLVLVSASSGVLRWVRSPVPW
jgi:hypothetical protein